MNMLERLPVGCQSLDLLLGGGFESGIITELYGESGSGKSNIVLQLAVAAVTRGLKVIFIDTEGFSAERFKQIAGPGAAEMAKKIMIFEPMSLEQQAMAIREASKIVSRDVGLVVLDSATSLYRMLLEAEDSRPARRALTVQLSELQEIARRHSIPVVITNQVYTDIESNTLRPLGGTYLEHMCKAIVLLEKAGEGLRRARLMKHRSLPENRTAQFRLTSRGLE
ncbi:MAG TPA: DNA repair and recombination protein RadB [Methanothrix sp.]|jgi:DNA repair protein RadB|uniref:DNA repair and recombination protein RadB n=1 Tax=Methanothrix sp. TaxID=90426 RepID=UPI002C5C33A0|nr:DNA repair and recombination protein RadB [Methanothrix sp.]MDI9418010.1 DNA repair and recombination protein RadB [Euryarchaeota archaeon]HON35288.1 DNA repair and recombination protein RadB [Methanothrix sp.]HRU75141.1 DNA repair and recombination protein RadB [Methanothrix sp.]